MLEVLGHEASADGDRQAMREGHNDLLWGIGTVILTVIAAWLSR